MATAKNCQDGELGEKNLDDVSKHQENVMTSQSTVALIVQSDASTIAFFYENLLT